MACPAADQTPIGTVLVTRLTDGEANRMLEPDQLESVHAGDPWRVDIENDVRDSLVAPIGTHFDRAVEVLPDSQLRLAYAVLGEMSAAVTLRIRAMRADEPHDVLFERTLSPEQAASWAETEIDLPAGVGPELQLRFEATSDGEGNAAAVWGHPAIARPQKSRAPDVLLISVDTLRADHLSLYGYPKLTSPKLSSWAQRSAIVFETVVAAAPWTLPAHVSMFTGLDAVRHGVNHDVGGIEMAGSPSPFWWKNTLASVLRREGYATAAITGGGYMHPKYGLTAGFDSYRYWGNRSDARMELASGVSDALRLMDAERDTPLFLFLHTYEVHDPYFARQPHFDRFASQATLDPAGRAVAIDSPESHVSNGFAQVNEFMLWEGPNPRPVEDDELAFVMALYDSSIAYMDEQMGRLLTGLADLELANGTLVIFTSDHGQALGEGGRVGHIDLHDGNLLVPLIIAAPNGLGAGTRVSDQVRATDILPTVLEGLGLPPRDDVDGVSLLPLMRGESIEPSRRAAWSYGAAGSRGVSRREGSGLKYVLNNSAWVPLAHSERFYDLRTDAKELDDRSRQDPRVPALRAAALDYLNTHALGLRLRIQNTGDGRLRGVLSGPMVTSVGTKFLDFSCACLSWKDAGQAVFELPPGSSMTVLFEKVFGTELRISGELSGGASVSHFDRIFRVGEIEAPQSLALSGSQEPRQGSLSESETGFELWWVGGGVSHLESPALVDPELAEQLRALGYAP